MMEGENVNPDCIAKVQDMQKLYMQKYNYLLVQIKSIHCPDLACEPWVGPPLV